jgi:hypothetical protein
VGSGTRPTQTKFKKKKCSCRLFCGRTFNTPDLSSPDLLYPGPFLAGRSIPGPFEAGIEATRRNAAPLSQGPGEQHILQLLVSQQAAQVALGAALQSRNSGKTGIGCRADSCTAHTGDRKRELHGGSNLLRGRQQSAGWLKKKSRRGGGGDSGQQIIHTGSHAAQARIGVSP